MVVRFRPNESDIDKSLGTWRCERRRGRATKSSLTSSINSHCVAFVPSTKIQSFSTLVDHVTLLTKASAALAASGGLQNTCIIAHQIHAQTSATPQTSAPSAKVKAGDGLLRVIIRVEFTFRAHGKRGHTNTAPRHLHAVLQPPEVPQTRGARDHESQPPASY